MLEDGYQSLITLENDPDISLWEKTVKPPGIDGGDAIEQTTMHNVTMRTMALRALKTLTDANSTVAYDPVVYNQLLAQVNVNQLITVIYPNGDTLDFYGGLRVFEPSDLAEGEQPEATINITATNVNPATGLETLPNYISASGTDQS
jgi:hypothetical protein